MFDLLIFVYDQRKEEGGEGEKREGSRGYNVLGVEGGGGEAKQKFPLYLIFLLLFPFFYCTLN